MRRKKRAVNLARVDVISGPRIVRSCAFETDPAILCGVADGFGSSLVVPSVVRSVWLRVKSVVDGLAVWASAWTCREFAASEAWSRDGHEGTPGMVTPSRQVILGAGRRMRQIVFHAVFHAVSVVQ